MESACPSPQKPRSLAPAGLWLLGGAGVSMLAVRTVVDLPAVPYNVRELFPARHPALSMAACAVLLTWMSLAPAAIASLASRRPAWAAGVCLWTALAALAGWFLADAAFTHESLHDVLGSPVLGWGRDWELLLRFLALHGGVLLIWTIAHLVVLRLSRTGLRGVPAVLGGVLAAAPALALARWVVIDRAATDNLTELLRDGGEAWLALLLALSAVNASLLALSWRRRRWLLPALLLTAALLPVGWGLLNLALEPAVEKYGRTFPAVRFLLGVDRDDARPMRELFVRWGAVQTFMVAMLGWGVLTAEAAARALSGQGGPVRRAWLPRRLWLALLAAYAAMVVYGHLVPLNFASLSLADAWRAFGPMLRLGNTGFADMLANILLYVPLTFLAMAAAMPRHAGRCRRLALAAGVLLGGMTLSLTTEFLQLWVPGRSVSLDDVVSQTVGGLIGLTAYLTAGPAVTGWLAGLTGLGQVDGPTRPAVGVLGAYAAMLAFYLTLPMDLSLSARQLYHRLRDGDINPWPLSDLSRQGLFGLASGAAMLVPVGALAALLARDRARPRWWAWAWGAGFLLGVTSVRMLVRSAAVSATDVLTGLLGVGGGVWLACRLYGAGGDRRVVPPRWLSVAAALLWLACVVEFKWRPFDFALPDEGLWAHLARQWRGPLFAGYSRRVPLSALAQMMREFAPFFLLGLLLRAAAGASMTPRRRTIAAASAVAVAAIVLEPGQTLLPARQTDATTTVLNLAGGLLGAILAPVAAITPHGRDGRCAAEQ